MLRREPTDKQRLLVQLLTQPDNCLSLNRALRVAGYGTHRPNLQQYLTSETMVALFRDALAAGRRLPWRHAVRIMAAIAALDAKELA
jgi:hypothetical protein